MINDWLSRKTCRYIMSPSRGTSKGEVLWSTCSQRVMSLLDKPCLQESQSNTAKDDPQYDHKRYVYFLSNISNIYIWSRSILIAAYCLRADLDKCLDWTGQPVSSASSTLKNQTWTSTLQRTRGKKTCAKLFGARALLALHSTQLDQPWREPGKMY